MSTTPPSTNLEREAKLQAPAGFRLPELGGDGLVATGMEPQRLVTVYVDTPDLRIARWGCSLRHRQGEGQETGWTVKLPSPTNGSQLVRTEVNFEGDDARKLPTAAADLLRAYVRDAGARAGRAVADGPQGRRDHRRSGNASRRGDRRRGIRDGRTTRGEPLPRAGGRARSRGGREALGGPGRTACRDAGAGPVDNVPKLVRALGPRAALAARRRGARHRRRRDGPPRWCGTSSRPPWCVCSATTPAFVWGRIPRPSTRRGLPRVASARRSGRSATWSNPIGVDRCGTD